MSVFSAGGRQVKNAGIEITKLNGEDFPYTYPESHGVILQSNTPTAES